MSTTLRMSDGDLFINRETGRGEEITGPTKVDQELADLFLTKYDPDRNWGSEFDLESFSVLTFPIVKTLLYVRVSQATARIISKQARDATLTPEETISEFSRIEVAYVPFDQTGYFMVVAEVGDTSITQKTKIDFKPSSLKHIIPPSTDIANKMLR